MFRRSRFPKKVGHGGAREGSGRPTLAPADRMRTVSIMLREDQIRYLKRLAGSLGAAVRKLIERDRA